MVAVNRNASTLSNHLSAGVAVVMNSPVMGSIAMVSASNGNCACFYTDIVRFGSICKHCVRWHRRMSF